MPAWVVRIAIKKIKIYLRKILHIVIAVGSRIYFSILRNKNDIMKIQHSLHNSVQFTILLRVTISGSA